MFDANPTVYHEKHANGFSRWLERLNIMFFGIEDETGCPLERQEKEEEKLERKTMIPMTINASCGETWFIPSLE